MKRWAILCFLSISSALFAEEEYCYCGTVKYDPFYAKAVFLLGSSIGQTGFNIGLKFPNVADEFYPPLEGSLDWSEPYPYEGEITWDFDKSYYLNKADMLKRVQENQHYYVEENWIPDAIKVPIKIVRWIEWTDSPGQSTYEHKEKKKFLFKRNYGAIPQAFHVLKDDVIRFYEKSELFLNARIRDMSNKFQVFESTSTGERPTSIKKLLARKQQVQSRCHEVLGFIEQKEAEALVVCVQSLDWCITHHHNPSAHVNRGLFYYLEGNTIEALDQIEAAVEKLEKDDFEKLSEDALLLKGQTELEAGLYADAVLTLTELINQNPVQKEAYFERAGAYFELGNFDLTLEDYLTSEMKLKPISPDSVEMLAFSLGLTKGIVQGGAQASIEFVPSLLSSLQGIGHGLWAFAQDPVQMSGTFIQASQDCINFIKEHTPQEVLMELAPELKELIEKWDGLEDEKRGESTGYIIGKYGVDIFAGAGLAKIMKSYRELKRANDLLTFEAMAISERNKSLIKLEAAKKAQARKEILQNGNLRIQPDKQGKHLIDHKNYIPSDKKSILEHPNPQRLVDEFAGKGMKAIDLPPGVPGYQEIVNFGEFIGYAIDRDTGEKIATSWGKIHYAKDGVHIVPRKPG